ncbi:glycosyltransferase [Phytomonospora endophytica]|uniref:4,4'-diaponeurosporenoate glycosyltransferase n=1 Tax=Phytomonospora endophytica TaxID=714109 RepID=A0A841FLJ9_9ACTN|nr:glycosyltransferase [Phytomonospora endophytica]MBB6038201.1 glycosyltransferase involved in cell wall biosynthesis [Phytomonospora endophytica]GIG67339.1 glycosyl transferase [Phytomonospora endophytica]
MTAASMPVLSVIIPAYNEADYLPRYLPTVLAALSAWQDATGKHGEVIVVDNDSTDGTAAVAEQFGARVVHEPTRNIGRVRNTGAGAAFGEYLFFVDADVAVPKRVFIEATDFMAAGAAGGAVAPVYRCKRLGARLLCAYWDWYRSRSGGAQGVAQFCTARAFWGLGGYSTELYMSEDVEFFARLRAFGEEEGRPVAVLEDLTVEPSTRRYDAWPSWRMFWWQNPITARMRLNSPRFWRHWYSSTVR